LWVFYLFQAAISLRVLLGPTLGVFHWDHLNQHWRSKITQIMVYKSSRWILDQSVIIYFFDVPWSEPSEITDSDSDHPNRTYTWFKISEPLYLHMCFPVSNVVIASAASFHDIETDWKWLEKYLLETLGKF